MSSRIEIKLPSQLVFLGVPDAILMEVGSDLSCKQKSIDELGTSVIEACTNAMEHGNKLSEDLFIEVHFTVNEERIDIDVFDHGEGFDYDGWQPSEDLMRERGRGILIMREFTDELDFCFAEDGRFHVHLAKRLEPDD